MFPSRVRGEPCDLCGWESIFNTTTNTTTTTTTSTTTITTTKTTTITTTTTSTAAGDFYSESENNLKTPVKPGTFGRGLFPLFTTKTQRNFGNKFVRFAAEL